MSAAGKKVLVTGSHGFLGGAFVELLKKKNVPYLRYDRSHPEELAPDFDSVVHFGGLTPMSPTNKPITPEDYRRANVEETELLLKTIVKNKRLKRFVNIGSAAEYGPHTTKINEDAREKPVGAYGTSKLEQSKIVERFAKESGVGTINLRIFNIAGLPAHSIGRPHKPSVFESLAAQFSKNFKGVVE